MHVDPLTSSDWEMERVHCTCTVHLDTLEETPLIIIYNVQM